MWPAVKRTPKLLGLQPMRDRLVSSDAVIVSLVSSDILSAEEAELTTSCADVSLGTKKITAHENEEL